MIMTICLHEVSCPTCHIETRNSGIVLEIVYCNQTIAHTSLYSCYICLMCCLYPSSMHLCPFAFTMDGFFLISKYIHVPKESISDKEIASSSHILLKAQMKSRNHPAAQAIKHHIF